MEEGSLACLVLETAVLSEVAVGSLGALRRTTLLAADAGAALRAEVIGAVAPSTEHDDSPLVLCLIDVVGLQVVNDLLHGLGVFGDVGGFPVHGHEYGCDDCVRRVVGSRVAIPIRGVIVG
jgi:hypothetical protein